MSRTRVLLAAMVLATLMGGAGYLVYAGLEGGRWVIHPDLATDCRTPQFQYGWAYEAVSYEIGDDARLQPKPAPGSGATGWTCPDQGTASRDDVVTTDGIRIAGWYIPAADGTGVAGPTILLVHGRSSNKSEILRYAPPLHDAYNLLVIDLRNGGRSGGTETTMGAGEGRDVAAALDWLLRTRAPSWVAGIGVSLGGVALLQAAPAASSLRAVVLDSVHARIADALGNGVQLDRGYPAWPTGWAMATGASLMLGVDISQADPVRTIVGMGDRPVLFLHGTADPYDIPGQSVEVNLRAAEAAGVPAQVRYCQGAGHAQVRDRCPDEWAAWVMDFLAGARAADQQSR